MPTVIGFNPALKKQCTCKNCGAINEYVPNDVRVLYEGRDITGCYEYNEGFNCANCGKEIIIKSW